MTARRESSAPTSFTAFVARAPRVTPRSTRPSLLSNRSGGDDMTVRWWSHAVAEPRLLPAARPAPSAARPAPSFGASVRLVQRLGERADAVLMIARAPLAVPTLDSYRRYLCDLYGFISALEARLVYTWSLDSAFLQTHIPSGRMATDLLGVGLTSYERTRLARRCCIPQFANVHVAIGWMFVLERIMRDLPAIRRDLREKLPMLLD